MASTKRIAVGLLGGIGFLLLTIVPMFIRANASEGFLVILSLIGSILVVTGIIWSERHRQTEGVYDERNVEIQFRSGWYAFWMIMAPAFAMNSIIVFTDRSTPSWVITGILVGGVLVYYGARIWLGRKM